MNLTLELKSTGFLQILQAVEDHGVINSLVACQTVFGEGVHWDDRSEKGYKQFCGTPNFSQFLRFLLFYYCQKIQ